MPKREDYSKSDIIAALLAIGIRDGDCLFTHSNIGFFGFLSGAVSPQDYYNTFKEAIFTVLGATGTWVHPTFSYSFCNQQPFYYESTPGVCGILAELGRKDTEAIRSLDPNFSVSAIGEDAISLTENAPHHSFGNHSFWERFLTRKGKILNFNFDAGSTFIHYVERELQVPYRYDKGFSGDLYYQGRSSQETYYHYVRSLEMAEHLPNFPAFDARAKTLGLVKQTYLGKGSVLTITAEDTFNLIKEELEQNPNFLIKSD